MATDGYPLIFALRPLRFASAATRCNPDLGQIERVLKRVAHSHEAVNIATPEFRCATMIWLIAWISRF